MKLNKEATKRLSFLIIYNILKIKKDNIVFFIIIIFYLLFNRKIVHSLHVDNMLKICTL